MNGAGAEGERLRKMCIQRGYKLLWFTLLWLLAKLFFLTYYPIPFDYSDVVAAQSYPFPHSARQLAKPCVCDRQVHEL